jgi:hypothetical protein
MIRRVGDRAASMRPTMLGIDKQQNNGHIANYTFGQNYPEMHNA